MKSVSLLAAIFAITCAPALFAQPAKTGEGNLMVQGKNYSLGHAVAYESKVAEDEVIAVVLSGQAVSGDKLKEVREAEKEGNAASFNRPYLRLEFSKTGEFRGWSAGAGSTSLGHRSGKATGEAKFDNDRAVGKANQPSDTDGMFSSGFDVRFDVALLKGGESLAEKKRGPAANVKPTVTGVFKGNGKDGKIAYVSAHWREPFSDKPSMVLIFTEKDHSKDAKPDFNASFSKFGNALIVSLHEDGSIFGCQVVHSAHKHPGFTALGKLETNNFEYADGKVEGELTTGGPDEVFGDTWEADLKFVVPLGEIPPQFQPATSKKSEKAAKKGKDDDDDEIDVPAEVKSMMGMTDEKPAAKAPANQLNVKDLAVTKDASDFEYKAFVQHVNFKSKASVKSACSELTANLKAQGWKNDGSDLVTPQSAILKRKRGEATLTIFVKPDGSGSTVQIFTQGLSWEGQ